MDHVVDHTVMFALDKRVVVARRAANVLVPLQELGEQILDATVDLVTFLCRYGLVMTRSPVPVEATATNTGLPPGSA